MPKCLTHSAVLPLSPEAFRLPSRVSHDTRLPLPCLRFCSLFWPSPPLHSNPTDGQAPSPTTTNPRRTPPRVTATTNKQTPTHSPLLYFSSFLSPFCSPLLFPPTSATSNHRLHCVVPPAHHHPTLFPLSLEVHEGSHGVRASFACFWPSLSVRHQPPL
uniref:Uncharacterized protein n=1 Tax=Opuntia streptacantha TaxID=393608 RepID=A0A7C9A0T3_OPUST